MRWFAYNIALLCVMLIFGLFIHSSGFLLGVGWGFFVLGILFALALPVIEVYGQFIQAWLQYLALTHRGVDMEEAVFFARSHLREAVQIVGIRLGWKKFEPWQRYYVVPATIDHYPWDLLKPLDFKKELALLWIHIVCIFVYALGILWLSALALVGMAAYWLYRLHTSNQQHINETYIRAVHLKEKVEAHSHIYAMLKPHLQEFYKQGKKDEQIIELLLEKGWPKKEVIECVNKYTHSYS